MTSGMLPMASLLSAVLSMAGMMARWSGSIGRSDPRNATSAPTSVSSTRAAVRQSGGPNFDGGSTITIREQRGDERNKVDWCALRHDLVPEVLSKTGRRPWCIISGKEALDRCGDRAVDVR